MNENTYGYTCGQSGYMPNTGADDCETLDEAYECLIAEIENDHNVEVEPHIVEDRDRIYNELLTSVRQAQADGIEDADFLVTDPSDGDHAIPYAYSIYAIEYDGPTDDERERYEERLGEARYEAGKLAEQEQLALRGW